MPLPSTRTDVAQDGGREFVDFLREHAGVLDDLMLVPYADETTADLRRYLYDPLTRFTANAGKRVRPLICLLACHAVGGEPLAASSAACAIEHFQSAALIHDDIADEGQLRRGEPCMYLTEGVGVATNCGDLALSEVFGLVANDTTLPEDIRLAVLAELFSMTHRTIEGQALDLGWARDGRWDVSVDDYLSMAMLKTAHYSAAVPLAVGATIGGGTSRQIEALRSFGLKTGLAFQLQDDLLNLFGDAEGQGKDYRSDLTEGKRTLLVVWALAHVSASEREELVRLLSSHVTSSCELGRAAAIIQRSGAMEHVREYATTLAAEAKGLLHDLDLDATDASTLRSMADFFVTRTS
ncbi:MAG: polyprenyl synthetase family protein [Atopobiaceae bacterium]|jgi:geranylgeranyl diphosphate synthase type I|nr:polyprenyl synthetase family protein [Atopobiaceae bacterium]MCI2173974.1 polyprenyl synthetase family protein [Atopobiaceae bacterium]MCI2207936.1 polyprenyl synthetase family protein [Atopobiaceae bacterium]